MHLPAWLSGVFSFLANTPRFRVQRGVGFGQRCLADYLVCLKLDNLFLGEAKNLAQDVLIVLPQARSSPGGGMPRGLGHHPADTGMAARPYLGVVDCEKASPRWTQPNRKPLLSLAPRTPHQTCLGTQCRQRHCARQDRGQAFWLGSVSSTACRPGCHR